MRILLEEERDAPVDVQVGFQLYEDAPQELRSRLWMALLHHPELSVRFQAVLKETAPQNEGDGAGEPSETHAEEGKVPTNNQIGDAPESTAPAVEQLSDAGEQQIQGGAEASPRSPHGAAEEGGWEVVTDRGTQRYWQGRQLLAGGSFHRMEPWSSAREAYRQDLMAAMAALPWPVPVEPPPEGRYATLLQISIGQEETDDVIARDIHRTFPEHPQFSFEQGQQALFRVLKAYSLHDLEVGYCQGMAFVAGLLLFYVPEEPAFDIFCRLLAATGPNLRRHYLPGLHGLKMELCKFEWLLGKHLPNLRAHLEVRPQ